jgi:hypothetical protein
LQHHQNKKIKTQYKIMKYIITLVLALGLATNLIAQNGPKISFTNQTHDFGNVPQGPNAVYEFEVTNTGNAPLIIQKCSGSCHCTKPTCPTAPIMPGAKSKIKVEFETKDKDGNFNKSVTIKCNATNINPNIGGYEIFIKGNVVVKKKAGVKKKK